MSYYRHQNFDYRESHTVIRSSFKRGPDECSRYEQFSFFLILKNTRSQKKKTEKITHHGGLLLRMKSQERRECRHKFVSVHDGKRHALQTKNDSQRGPRRPSMRCRGFYNFRRKFQLKTQKKKINTKLNFFLVYRL